MTVILGKQTDRAEPIENTRGPCETRVLSDLPVPRYFRFRAVVDRVMAIVLLVPGLPIIGLLVLLVRLTSRGPGIFRQNRLGKGGRTFTLYKIRTMIRNAEAATGAIWSPTNDPRITPVGRVLRKLHLDELPQLFNVLKGEMGLIGPRPERPEFAYVLTKDVPGYLDRLAVRPGVTGLAQINLPPDSDLESVRRKLALDVEYIKHTGILLDVRIFLCTFVRLLGLPGVFVMVMFRLQREVSDLDARTPSNGQRLTYVVPQQTPSVAPSAAPSANGNRPLNALTIDVEDYFQVSGFEKDISRDRWDHWDSRVVANTHRVLKLLDRHGVKATFFVLGWVARHYPQLVQEISSCGHEIGSHSYWHRLVYEQLPEEFRSDLQQSRDILTDTIGQRITAHRAPSFSITKRSLWALEILVEEGFLVDTSVYPTYHDRYGIPDAEPRIHRITTPAGPLWEFPPSVAKFARLSLPVSGGGYFRLYPLQLTLRLLTRINHKQRRPFMFYVHPWEFDPEQPRIQAGSRMSRARHYVNLASTESKLATLLERFRFGRLCDAIQEAQSLADGTTDSLVDAPTVSLTNSLTNSLTDTAVGISEDTLVTTDPSTVARRSRSKSSRRSQAAERAS
ncbi:MAG: hypothetical protein A2V70_06090 [Planctomycetes bacterium RBG_13_63_9]|nr:MAG: hypothetical protein A2V70_06090 [Planctomycetes bacterium RBG_13_63_9]